MNFIWILITIIIFIIIFFSVNSNNILIGDDYHKLIIVKFFKKDYWFSVYKNEDAISMSKNKFLNKIAKEHHLFFKNFLVSPQSANLLKFGKLRPIVFEKKHYFLSLTNYDDAEIIFQLSPTPYKNHQNKNFLISKNVFAKKIEEIFWSNYRFVLINIKCDNILKIEKKYGSAFTKNVINSLIPPSFSTEIITEYEGNIFIVTPNENMDKKIRKINSQLKKRHYKYLLNTSQLIYKISISPLKRIKNFENLYYHAMLTNFLMSKHNISFFNYEDLELKKEYLEQNKKHSYIIKTIQNQEFKILYKPIFNIKKMKFYGYNISLKIDNLIFKNIEELSSLIFKKLIRKRFEISIFKFMINLISKQIKLLPKSKFIIPLNLGWINEKTNWDFLEINHNIRKKIIINILHWKKLEAKKIKFICQQLQKNGIAFTFSNISSLEDINLLISFRPIILRLNKQFIEKTYKNFYERNLLQQIIKNTRNYKIKCIIPGVNNDVQIIRAIENEIELIYGDFIGQYIEKPNFLDKKNLEAIKRVKKWWELKEVN